MLKNELNNFKSPHPSFIPQESQDVKVEISQYINSTNVDSLNILLTQRDGEPSKNRRKTNYHSSNPSQDKNKMENNFMKAIKLINSTVNSTQMNLSEFPDSILDISKEENIINYLHKPLKKTFTKKGNDLFRTSYQHDFKASINLPYAMKPLFKCLLPKVIEIDDEEDENEKNENNEINIELGNEVIGKSSKNSNNKNFYESIQNKKSTAYRSYNDKLAVGSVKPFNYYDKDEGDINDLDEVMVVDVSNYTKKKNVFNTINNSSNVSKCQSHKEGNVNKENNFNNIFIEDASNNEDYISNKNSIITYSSNTICNNYSNYNNFYINDNNSYSTKSKIINRNVSNSNSNSNFNFLCNNKFKTTTDKKIPTKYHRRELYLESIEKLKLQSVNNINSLNNNTITNKTLNNVNNPTYPSISNINNSLFRNNLQNNYSNFKSIETKVEYYNHRMCTINTNSINTNNNISSSQHNVNKNLMDKFNYCNSNSINASYNNNENLQNDLYKSPSIEKLDFASINDNNSVNKKINNTSFIDINFNITPIKQSDTNRTNNNNLKTPLSKIKDFSVTINQPFLNNNMNKQKIRNPKSKSFILTTEKNKVFTTSKISFDLSNTLSAKKYVHESLLSNSSYISLNNKNLSRKNSKEPSSTRNANSDSNVNNAPEQNYGQTIYDIDFYHNLLNYEKNKANSIPSDYLKNHNEIKAENRAVLINWIMQICEEFAFKRETFYYAVNYLDRYLSRTSNIPLNQLQILGVTCISLAGKIEEIQIPKLLEYANSLNDKYTVKNIIEYEIKIITKLKWRIIPITINTWLNWYICQWDLFIDTVDEIKDTLLKYFDESEIIYFKKSDDKSYYNYRKITQLLDCVCMDYNHLKFNQRYIIAGLIFSVISINYKFKFEFYFKKTGRKQTAKKEKVIFDVYNNFVSQSFDLDICNDDEVMKTIEYCFKFLDFEFNFDLPLVYQVGECNFENGNYEDFLTYQTFNDKGVEYLKKINQI